MTPENKILITGAGGLAGRNLVAWLQKQGFKNIVGLTSRDCDLTDGKAAIACFERHAPTHVFHMAGHVFGIMGNMKNQAAAYYNNNLINTFVIEAAQRAGVQKIVAMGTVAMYPDPLPGNPLLQVERVSDTYGDRPVELRKGLNVTSHFHYRNSLN